MAEGKGGYRSLTADEVKALDEADDILSRAFNEARDKSAVLRDASDHVPEGTLRCFRCSCEEFVSRPNPGSGSTRPPSHICQRSTCRHSFFSHDVF